MNKVSRKPPPADMVAGSDDVAAMPFEAALERLEGIVEALERGELTLEESLARYEEGVRLSRRLTQTLDEAEKRIERLVEGEGQTPTTKSMELDLKVPEADSDDLPF